LIQSKSQDQFPVKLIESDSPSLLEEGPLNYNNNDILFESPTIPDEQDIVILKIPQKPKSVRELRNSPGTYINKAFIDQQKKHTMSPKESVSFLNSHASLPLLTPLNIPIDPTEESLSKRNNDNILTPIKPVSKSFRYIKSARESREARVNARKRIPRQMSDSRHSVKPKVNHQDIRKDILLPSSHSFHDTLTGRKKVSTEKLDNTFKRLVSDNRGSPIKKIKDILPKTTTFKKKSKKILEPPETTILPLSSQYPTPPIKTTESFIEEEESFFHQNSLQEIQSIQSPPILNPEINSPPPQSPNSMNRFSSGSIHQVNGFI